MSSSHGPFPLNPSPPFAPKRTVGPPMSALHGPSRRKPSQTRAYRVACFLPILSFAACLSDDPTLEEAKQTLGTVGPDEDSDAESGAVLALPPGAIVDTEPNSGWTEGSLSVNHNGAAEYDVPLWVPDGRRGLQPTLGLHYNSQNGNGLLGVGWSLQAGLSSISPCSRTLARDGRIENPGFGRTDAAYCLDGQRLRPAVGAGNQEQDYRTEQDTFARIRAYHTAGNANPPVYFKVWTKDGRIMTYDAPLAAYRLVGQNPENPSFSRSASRVTAAWMLRKIEDRNGNTITIQYETLEKPSNQWSVEMVPKLITYGPDRTIEFLYFEERSDKVTTFKAGRTTISSGFDGGIHTDLSRLLKTIKVSAGTQLLREYRLDYGQSPTTERSRLIHVTECDSAVPAICLNPLTFGWSGGFNSTYEVIDTDVKDAAIAAWSRRFYIPGDINGDGKDDLLYRDENNDWKIRLSLGDRFDSARDAGIPKVSGDYNTKARAIDFDRDGRMDVMVEIPGAGSRTKFRLYRSTGETYQEVFSDPDQFAWTVAGDFQGGLWNGFFADIDGNGLPDYLGPALEWRPDEEPAIRMAWKYSLNLGSGFGSFVNGPITAGPITEVGEDVPFDYQIKTMASDGRRPRLLHWLAGDSSSYTALGGTQLTQSAYALNLPFRTGPENVDRRDLHFADVNGDGLEDAVYPCTGMKVQLSSGLGFSEIIDGPPEYEPCPIAADDNLRVRVVDVTADGNDDILLTHSGIPESSADFRHGVQIYTWTGRRLSRKATDIGVTPVEQGGEPIGAIQPLDFNGDGLMDFAKVARAGLPTTTSFLQIFKREGEIPDKLIRVSVPNVGDRVEVDYTTLADSSVHTPGTENCVYPLTCPRRGGSIVSAHRVANGVDAVSPWHEFKHQYRAARTDVRGHGWLGFEQHDVQDQERAGAVTTTILDNHTTGEIPVEGGVTAYVYPFAGQPDKVISTLTSGTVNSFAVTYEHTIDKDVRFGLGASSGTWVSRLDNVAVSDREKVGNAGWTDLHSRTTYQEYDVFNNVKKATTVWSDSDSSLVVETPLYRNDTTNWIIGLPQRTTARSCATGSGVMECATRTKKLDYYDNGNLKEVVIEPNDPTMKQSSIVEYGTYGNLQAITTSGAVDSSGTIQDRRTSFGYDSVGLFVKTITNPKGHVSEVTIHPGLGVVLQHTDPNLVRTTMKYDRFGRPREVNHEDGSFERFHIGLFSSTTDLPNGTGGTYREEFSRDTLGRLVRRTVPAFKVAYRPTTDIQYDRLGRVSKVSRPYRGLSGDPVYFATYAYDGRDRLLTMSEPGGAITRHEYIGRESHTYDAKGNHSFVVEAADGRIEVRKEDVVTGLLQTRFGYGPFGLLRKVTAADATVQSTNYDSLGRAKKHIDPSTGTTTASYNAFGEMLETVDGAGNTTDIDYDLLGRPVLMTSPDGSTTYTWDTAPLGKGELANETSPDGVTTSYAFNGKGQTTLASWLIQGIAYSVDFEYDDIGRLGSLTYPQMPGAAPRLKVSYKYNARGYLERIEDAATSVLYWRVDDRNAAGQLTQETYGNNVVGTRVYSATTGLLDTIATSGPTGDLDRLQYGYDLNRNVRSRKDFVGLKAKTQEYGYDRLNRLITWEFSDAAGSVSTSFAYDSMGNLRSETITPAPPPDDSVTPTWPSDPGPNVGCVGSYNCLCGTPVCVNGRWRCQGDCKDNTSFTVTYGYGENGASPHAVTSRHGGPFEGDASYTYDDAGRQTTGLNRTVIYNGFGLPKRLTRLGEATTFAYDAGGARVLKRDPDNQTTITVAGLFERRVDGGAKNIHYLMADGRAVAQLARTQATPSGPVTSTDVLYLHGDGQGSVIQATDSSRAVVAEFFYDPFGRDTDEDYNPLPSPDRSIRRGYTGHDHDDQFRLINMKGRIYDPLTRHFLTPDPFIGRPLDSQNYNRYSYVGNNPTTFIDPSGFFGELEVCKDADGNDCGNDDEAGGGLDPIVVAGAVVAGVAAGVGYLACQIFCGDDAEEAPSSDDNNLTDGRSNTGSWGGLNPTDNWVTSNGTGQGWEPECFGFFCGGRFRAGSGAGGDFGPSKEEVTRLNDYATCRARGGGGVCDAVEAKGGLDAVLSQMMGARIPSLGPVRGVIEGELGESLAGREIFLHGTTDEVAQSFELQAGRSLFTTTDRAAARLFAERTIAKVGGGQVGGVAIVLPRAAANQLRSLGQLIVRPVSDMPQIIEWVFLPGARETILRLGEIIRLPPGGL